MTIQFPPAPGLGEPFLDWTWDGEKWIRTPPDTSGGGGDGGGAPTGPAGGDLSGTYPNPRVISTNGTNFAPSATTDTTNAGNITSGTMTLSRLPTIPPTQISGLAASATIDTTNANNITSGTISLSMLPAIPPGQISGLPSPIGTVTNVATGAGLSGGPITNAGTIDADWRAGQVNSISGGLSLSPAGVLFSPTGGDPGTSTAPSGPASGDLDGQYPNPIVISTHNDPFANSATIDATNAENISSGTLALARLPTIPTSQISGLPPSASIDTTNATNITSGTLAIARLPSIPISQISGLPPSASVDTTNASNIASGTLDAARLPAVTPNPAGSYTSANITVDNLGRVTQASSGSAGPGDGGGITSITAGAGLTGGTLNAGNPSGTFVANWRAGIITGISAPIATVGQQLGLSNVLPNWILVQGATNPVVGVWNTTANAACGLMLGGDGTVYIANLDGGGNYTGYWRAAFQANNTFIVNGNANVGGQLSTGVDSWFQGTQISSLGMRLPGNYILGFGWNGNVNLYVDGGYQGDMATVAWVNAVTSNVYSWAGGTFATFGWVDAYYQPRGSFNAPDQNVNYNSSPTFWDCYAQWFHGGQGVSANGWGVRYGNYNGGVQFAFLTNYYVLANDGAFGTINSLSSRRFKDNITDSSTDCLAVIEQLKLHQYDYTPDSHHVPVGFVAEEVDELLPGAGMRDHKGEIGAYDHGVIQATLAGAIQQLSRRIAALEGRQ